ncbi:MAG: hypothetical protein HQ485_11180 [Acidobacteria bacterium]|nr:hypothetical protein [Acidobacteriota bacterium]
MSDDSHGTNGAHDTNDGQDNSGDHPTEDALVLLFYGDTNTVEEARLTAHVESCVTCQPVWQNIRATLAAVDSAAVPEPPDDFERVMWARVQSALADVPPERASWWAPRYWMPATALAAALMAMFLMSRPTWSGLTGGPETAAASTQPERALLVAMDDHLERSELLLVEVMNAPDNDAVFASYERETADDLLSSSRLYRQTANHTGHLQLASLLEDLERILVEIARSPEELNREDLDALRSHIEQDDLIFKVRVFTDEVRERQKTISTSTASEGDQ